MKKTQVLLAMLILLSMEGGAQVKQHKSMEQTIKAKDIPRAVMDEFKRAYPLATMTGCSKEKEKGKVHYEIESKDGTTARDVVYEADGTLVVVEESIAYADLPQPVRDAIRKTHPGAMTVKAEKLITREHVQYEVVLKSGNETLELVFDPDGTVAGREKR